MRSPLRSSSSARARRRRRYASSPPRRSECVTTQLSGADAPDRLDREHPVLAVADRSRACVLDDRGDDLVGVAVLDHELEPDLRDVLDVVLGTSVDLGVALLTSV